MNCWNVSLPLHDEDDDDGAADDQAAGDEADRSHVMELLINFLCPTI